MTGKLSGRLVVTQVSLPPKMMQRIDKVVARRRRSGVVVSFAAVVRELIELGLSRGGRHA